MVESEYMEPIRVALFKGNRIRKIIHENEWWFSVVDVVQTLTDQSDDYAARKYWNKLSQRLRAEGSEVVTKCHRLKLLAADGKKYETDCADTEGIFRIVQSIPSPKAEPFKRWLAKVGYERIQEIDNPELATKRTRMLYKLKGYGDDWIEKRIQGIAIREELTDEWQTRGAAQETDYEILTAEISKATFGVTPNEYKKLKDDAKIGGNVAGIARKELEKQLGRTVVSKKNYVTKQQDEKSLNN